MGIYQMKSLKMVKKIEKKWKVEMIETRCMNEDNA